ncbi:Hpt domain-containing protein [Neptunicoccus sediminis]|uniref:Hpt domain-containing protein n=1 Tax=Neptunicoccus sediminis TaxID=1892596 RepID=UPI000845FF76|nr:Hpt domain-containing protein [Neptunicoccus sediminis]
MINWAQVRQLEQDVGPEDIGAVIALFLAEVEEAIKDLQAMPPDDTEKIGAMLHFLKGCASNVGFEAFAENCAQGELKAQNGQISDVSTAAVAKIYEGSKQLFLAEFSAHSTAQL